VIYELDLNPFQKTFNAYFFSQLSYVIVRVNSLASVLWARW